VFYASDYFDQLYCVGCSADPVGQGFCLRFERRGDCAGIAGTLTEPGKESPYRKPFRWKKIWTSLSGCAPGEFPDGARTLRAKVDMASPNLNMRDPRDVPHSECGSITGPEISGPFIRCTTMRMANRIRSRRLLIPFVTLEFEDHRPLYDWFIEQLGIFQSKADRIRPPESGLTRC